MVEIRESITVPAPVEEVYRYMDASVRLIELTPGMQKHGDLSEKPTGKDKDKESRVEYTYEMQGMPVRGSVEITESERNRKVVYRLTGPSPATFTWTFEPEGDSATRVAVHLDYGAAVPMPDSMLSFFTKAYNENQLGVMLDRLRSQFMR